MIRAPIGFVFMLFALAFGITGAIWVGVSLGGWGLSVMAGAAVGTLLFLLLALGRDTPRDPWIAWGPRGATRGPTSWGEFPGVEAGPTPAWSAPMEPPWRHLTKSFGLYGDPGPLPWGGSWMPWRYPMVAWMSQGLWATPPVPPRTFTVIGEEDAEA